MHENENYASILLEKIENADAICVGGASGMSVASGYDFYYRSDEIFLDYFGEFKNNYGYDGAFDGLYYPYETPEERWAFLATLCQCNYDMGIGKNYEDLATLIGDKNYYISTTNQDGQFSKIFPEDKVSIIQGDWRYLQCCRPCHDKIYDARDVVSTLYKNIDGCKVPEDLIPRCPKCGSYMEPWVRGYHFLEGTQYKTEYLKWFNFLEENRNRKILFLELGVGQMTPMFIKEPFWSWTYHFPDAYYISINPKDALMPEQLNGKGTLMHEDIAKVLKDAVDLK